MTTEATANRRPTVRPQPESKREDYPPTPGFFFDSLCLCFPGAARTCDNPGDMLYTPLFPTPADADTWSERDEHKGHFLYAEPRRCRVIVFPSDYEPENDAHERGEEAELVPMANGEMLLVAPIEPPLALKVHRMFQQSGQWMDVAMLDGALDAFTSLPPEKQTALIEYAVMKRNQYRELIDGKLPLPEPGPLTGRSKGVVALVKKAGNK